MDQATSLRSPARPGIRWLLAALLLAVAVGALLLFLPVVTGVQSSTLGNGPNPMIEVREVRQSLVQAEGWGVALLFLVPVLFCAMPLLGTGAARLPLAIAAVVLLGLGVLVSLASLGLFYLPSLVLLVVAAVRMSRRAAAPAS
ncbi:hypothetical protein GCM10022225_24940 [Plantactinospora mayteni]|uniref:DUF4064 domain-containing protein n=1 Tax=Plantactinospora mayteni TaxID=566021 RepID=A0ABQ4EJ67_9ACTN|nr:hypothetical protein [Plantactinospora mayteni]GIG94776.1 hypothetical protein Pma05_13490 [Plantactinospora mayteni]